MAWFISYQQNTRRFFREFCKSDIRSAPFGQKSKPYIKKILRISLAVVMYNKNNNL